MAQLKILTDLNRNNQMVGSSRARSGQRLLKRCARPWTLWPAKEKRLAEMEADEVNAGNTTYCISSRKLNILSKTNTNICLFTKIWRLQLVPFVWSHLIFTKYIFSPKSANVHVGASHLYLFEMCAITLELPGQKWFFVFMH